jgi:hypothetical protein
MFTSEIGAASLMASIQLLDQVCVKEFDISDVPQKIHPYGEIVPTKS